MQQILGRETATQALILVVDTGGLTIMARIGMMQALNTGESERRKPEENF